MRPICFTYLSQKAEISHTIILNDHTCNMAIGDILMADTVQNIYISTYAHSRYCTTVIACAHRKYINPILLLNHISCVSCTSSMDRDIETTLILVAGLVYPKASLKHVTTGLQSVLRSTSEYCLHQHWDIIQYQKTNWRGHGAYAGQSFQPAAAHVTLTGRKSSCPDVSTNQLRTHFESDLLDIRTLHARAHKQVKSRRVTMCNLDPASRVPSPSESPEVRQSLAHRIFSHTQWINKRRCAGVQTHN